MKFCLIVVLLFGLVFSVLGCGAASEAEEELKGLGKELEEFKESDEFAELEEMAGRVEELAEEIPSELAAVVDHFNDVGLDVEDVHPKIYDMIGAVGGIGLEVEGGGVELYLFDPETADEEVAKSLEDAHDTGIFLDHAMEMEIPVVMNGNIMLFGLEIFDYEHPEKDRVVEAFRSF